MSADPFGEPVRRTDDDVLGRLAAIDHHLHQISTQLASMGKLLSQLDEICANHETLIGSLGVARGRSGSLRVAQVGGSIVERRVPSRTAP